MTRISGGGRPPKDAGDVGKTASEPPAPDLRSHEGMRKFRDAARTEQVPAKVVDSFERAAPQLEKQLQAMSGRPAAGRIRFGSEELAQLAGAFAAVLKQQPQADRKERARLFARAILKHKRIGKLLAKASEQDLENMFEAIAAQLDGSPVLAQLVDEVTEGARKTSLR